MPVTRIEKLAKRTGVLEGGSVNFGWDGRSGRDDFTWLWPLPGISLVGLGRMRVRSDPDGSDRNCPRNQIRELVTPKITGRVAIV